ncbi:group II intron reverse transcriptase/maturase [Sphingobacterium spiritivorum]|uniref:group II intron reverse transcriptase/maturase n=1 Tax=Sphingobacterium spiritivorum TaxID=258 RepID=UPI003DA42E60
MRNSSNVLNGLSKHSQQLGYRYERLYRLLFNEEMFFAAYQRIYAKEGNMTEGSDGKTIDEMSLDRIYQLIEALRSETYQPKPARRTYIPKKNGKMRPLGIPTFDDKLVQEVTRMVLEAIYEGQFSDCSHGFRPQRSCHTALTKIQKTFTGAKWFIEGDIKSFFDGIDHEVLINILKERISDERFLRLIRKFLKAGYLEEWTFHNTHSGTPQGGIVSPILANIYLDKLDRYMEEYAKSFNKGKKKGPDKRKKTLDDKKHRLSLKLKVTEDKNERLALVEKIRDIVKEKLNVPACNEMDSDYKRLRYVRYADDFLIGIIGSKDDSKRIKEDIRKFLEIKLKLELSEEKTLITHTENPAKFLGYEVSVSKSNLAKRNKRGDLVRVYNKKVHLRISMETIKKKLFDFGVLELKKNNGKEVWKARERSKSLHNDDLEILQTYNYTIRGFHNYYAIANNSALLNRFKYIMEYSMYRTFATKYRSNVPAIVRKYKKDGIFTVQYATKKGMKNQTFYNESFARRKPVVDVQLDYNLTVYHSKNSLIDRLKAEKCELCGAEEKLEMHHVRKLKDLKGKSHVEKVMTARRRKTIALCKNCHIKTHAGKID